jgi:glutamate-1-semialdehyde 2,1-aminomutase
MLEPATTESPCPDSCTTVRRTDATCATCDNHRNNFLHQVKDLCHRNGSLFILDEMITGFRWHLNGAQAYFDIEPDLSTFGKGMANGFSVAALVGRKEIMNVGGIKDTGSERTFLISTTHGAEMPGLGAFVETVKFYKEANVINHLWNYGAKLFDGMNEISKSLGMSDYFYMDGNYISMNFVTKDKTGNASPEFRTLFVQEMINNGVLFPWIAVCYSHKEEELQITLKAVEASLQIYKKALSEGFEKYLVGDAVKPVFRKYN